MEEGMEPSGGLAKVGHPVSRLGSVVPLVRGRKDLAGLLFAIQRVGFVRLSQSLPHIQVSVPLIRAGISFICQPGTGCILPVLRIPYRIWMFVHENLRPDMKRPVATYMNFEQRII